MMRPAVSLPSATLEILLSPRVTFPNKILPYLLLAPQLAITLVFFYWPASQALYQSMLREDPFGLSTKFVWFQNFSKVLRDPNYLNSLNVTLIFAVATADNFLARGQAKTALVIGSETFSRLLDWDDRATCVLFGDGAGAVVLEAQDEACADGRGRWFSR